MSPAPQIVPDTNSLWNFAVVERLDILETRYGTRIQWTQTVVDEVDNSTSYEPLLDLLNHCPWLGAAIEFPDAGCVSDILRIQNALSGPDDPPSKNLGEAECIHYIEHELGGNGILLTDDRPAHDLASHRGITAIDTQYVMADAFAMGELQCPEPFSLLEQMRALGRMGVRIPPNHTYVC